MSIFEIVAVDGADVRLRGGRIGLVNVDVTAPVRRGRLVLGPTAIDLSLVLSLGGLRTGNFLLQSAARALISRNDADELIYTGTGAAGTPWQVSGHARAGTIDVALDLVIAPQPGHDDPAEIEISGRAALGRVDLPLPGLGTVDDLTFDVDARLAIRAG